MTSKSNIKLHEWLDCKVYSISLSLGSRWCWFYDTVLGCFVVSHSYHTISLCPLLFCSRDYMTLPLPNCVLNAGWPHWGTPEWLESIMMQVNECDTVLATFKRQNEERAFFFTIVISGTNTAFLSLWKGASWMLGPTHRGRQVQWIQAELKPWLTTSGYHLIYRLLVSKGIKPCAV